MLGSLTTREGNIRGSLRRALQPNAFGQVLETDTVSLSYQRKLSERIDLALTANYTNWESESTSAGLVVFESEFERFDVGPSLLWSFHPNFSARLHYEYRWLEEERGAFSGSGSANAFGIAIRYSPNRNRENLN